MITGGLFTKSFLSLCYQTLIFGDHHLSVLNTGADNVVILVYRSFVKKGVEHIVAEPGFAFIPCVMGNFGKAFGCFLELYLLGSFSFTVFNITKANDFQLIVDCCNLIGNSKVSNSPEKPYVKKEKLPHLHLVEAVFFIANLVLIL